MCVSVKFENTEFRATSRNKAISGRMVGSRDQNVPGKVGQASPAGTPAGLFYNRFFVSQMRST